MGRITALQAHSQGAAPVPLQDTHTMIVHTWFTEFSLALAYLEFALAALVIVLAGRKLTLLGDAIAEVTGLGRLWIGVTLIAMATSLPEIVTSLTAALHPTGAAINLAFGNVLGSNTFNLALIAVMDAMHRQGPILAFVSPRHIMTALFGIALIGLAGLGLALPRMAPEALGGSAGVGFSVAWCVVIALVFLYAMHRLYRQEQAAETAPLPDELVKRVVVKSRRGGLYGHFAAMALLVTAASIVTIGAGDAIGQRPVPVLGIMLGRSLVGTLLIALTTSLPEMTVTVAAMRIGARDIALGNVLGSNLMNIAILPLVALVSRRAIFVEAAVDPVHVVTAIVGVAMTIPVVIGLKARFRKGFLRIGWGTWLLVAVYVAGIYMVWQWGKG